MATLKEFLDGYADTRSDAKSSTHINWGHTIRNLLEYVGPDKPLRDITPGEADEWHLNLLDQALARSTVRKRCSNA